jgi:hypothetical protein
MAGFTYFIVPTDATITPGEIADAGLAYAFDVEPTQCAVDYSPSGDAGVLLSQAAWAGFDPALQTWQPMPGKSGVWIGYEILHPPTSVDLERPAQIDGHVVDLRGDTRWLVPLARRFPEGTNLPTHRTGLATIGQIVTAPLPEYEAIAGIADRLWTMFYEDAPVDLSPADELNLATDVLAVNYRVSGIELCIMDVLTTQNAARVLSALVDMPTVEQMLGMMQAGTDAGALPPVPPYPKGPAG